MSMSIGILARRLTLVVMVAILLAVTLIELGVALDLKLTRTLARWAMWVGSLTWVSLTLVAWVHKLKNSENVALWIVLLYTAISGGSVAGIYVPHYFLTFALWANVAVLFLLLAVMLYAFPHAWGDIDITKPPA